MYAWFLMLWNWTALSFTYHNVHFFFLYLFFFFTYFIVSLSIFSPYLWTCSTFYPSIYCYTCVYCYTPQKSPNSSYMKTYLAINLILILILMLAVGQTVQQMDRYKGSEITKRSSVASKKCKKKKKDRLQSKEKEILTERLVIFCFKNKSVDALILPTSIICRAWYILPLCHRAPFLPQNY